MITKQLDRRSFSLLAMGTLVSLSSRSAETYPSKTVRWIVAYSPGGGSDFLARTIANRLSVELGQTVFIDNRPGAATIIGAQEAARSNPDGYTIFSADNGSLVFNPALYSKLPYKTSDFAPIGLMARFPLLLVTTAGGSGYASASAMVVAAKADPTKLSYASPGAGGPHHLAMELFKERANFQAQHVAYKGAAPAVQDVIAGQVPVMMLDTATAMPQIKGKRLRALAVASAVRLSQYPDVPTFKELGFSGVEVAAWQGLVVPAATSIAVRERLGIALEKALTDASVIKSLTDFGLEVTPSNAAEMQAYIQAEIKQWHALIRERGLKLD